MHFEYDYKKESTQKNWLEKEQNLMESFKNYAQLKEYKFTLQ